MAIDDMDEYLMHRQKQMERENYRRMEQERMIRMGYPWSVDQYDNPIPEQSEKKKESPKKDSILLLLEDVV